MAPMASDLPPVIKGQVASEQRRFIRIGPDKKVRMLLDLKRSPDTTFGLKDCRALAYWSLKAECGSSLPQGVYANLRGDWFAIDDWGHESPLQFSPGQVWDSTRMTISHPGVIPPELVFSASQWLAPSQPFQMSVFPFAFPAVPQQNVPAANLMQQFPAAAVPLPDFEFEFEIDSSFPAAQQQFNLGPAPLFEDNAAQMQPHFNSPPPPTPLVPNNQVPSVLGTRGRLATENGSERAKRRRIEDTIDLTVPSPVPTPASVPVMEEQIEMPMTPPMTPPSHESTAAAEDTADPLSELLAFNAQTDWPSQEARLQHEEFNASLPSPPVDNEDTDSLYEEDLSVFADHPAIHWSEYVPEVC